MTTTSISTPIAAPTRRDRRIHFGFVSRAVAIIPAQVNQVFLVGEF